MISFGGASSTSPKFEPELRRKGSASAPGAVFRASRNTVGRSEKFQTIGSDDVVRSAGREARPATPVAGVLPNIFGIQVEIKTIGGSQSAPLRLITPASHLPRPLVRSRVHRQRARLEQEFQPSLRRLVPAPPPAPVRTREFPPRSKSQCLPPVQLWLERPRLPPPVFRRQLSFLAFAGGAGVFWPCPSGHRQIQGHDPDAPASANRQ